MLLSEIIPRILTHVQSLLPSTVDLPLSDVFESNLGAQFWLNLMQAIKDSYAVERMSEQLLQQLSTGYASDVEAYWILWLLFHRIFQYQASVRSVNRLPIIPFFFFFPLCYDHSGQFMMSPLCNMSKCGLYPFLTVWSFWCFLCQVHVCWQIFTLESISCSLPAMDPSICCAWMPTCCKFAFQRSEDLQFPGDLAASGSCLV